MLVWGLLIFLEAFAEEGEAAKKSRAVVYKRGRRPSESILRQQLPGCNVDLDTSSPTYPPFVYTVNGLLLPQVINSVRTLYLPEGETVTLACPGVGNYLTPTATTIAVATCKTASTFLVSGFEYTFKVLSCLKATKETMKEIGKCGSTLSGTSVSIGWDIGGTFNEQIKVCHNKVKMETLYVSAVVNGTGIAAKDLGDARPAFKKGVYFPGVAIDTMYSQSSQLSWFTSTFGSTLAAKYFNVAKNLYFARGHFSPEADFVWNVMQDATFYYINAAPQYQAFNNGNWKYLEFAVRNIAASLKIDLQVFTGSFQTLSLADSTGAEKAVYLGTDSNGNQIIPAPKFYWKVVYDPVGKRATAFVGINNPFLASLPSDYVLCNDVCPSVSWAPTNRQDYSQGYTYCCSLSELRAKIPDIPDLGSVSLLS